MYMPTGGSALCAAFLVAPNFLRAGTWAWPHRWRCSPGSVLAEKERGLVPRGARRVEARWGLMRRRGVRGTWAAAGRRGHPARVVLTLVPRRLLGHPQRKNWRAVVL